eukprot:5781144-Pleurochrysis_carterae.AAC.1
MSASRQQRCARRGARAQRSGGTEARPAPRPHHEPLLRLVRRHLPPCPACPAARPRSRPCARFSLLMRATLASARHFARFSFCSRQIASAAKMAGRGDFAPTASARHARRRACHRPSPRAPPPAPSRSLAHRKRSRKEGGNKMPRSRCSEPNTNSKPRRLSLWGRVLERSRCWGNELNVMSHLARQDRVPTSIRIESSTAIECTGRDLSFVLVRLLPRHSGYCLSTFDERFLDHVDKIKRSDAFYILCCTNHAAHRFSGELEPHVLGHTGALVRLGCMHVS